MTFKTQICHQGPQGILRYGIWMGIQMAEPLGFVWYPRRIRILLPCRKGWRMCGTHTLRFWLINFNSRLACGTLFCRGHCPHEPSLLLRGLALLMVVSNGHVSAMIEVFSRKLAFKRREVRLRPRRTKVVFDSFHPCLRHP